MEKEIIDQGEYIRFKEKYDVEIAGQEKQMERLRESFAEHRETRRQDDEFVSYFRRYGNTGQTGKRWNEPWIISP